MIWSERRKGVSLPGLPAVALLSIQSLCIPLALGSHPSSSSSLYPSVLFVFLPRVCMYLGGPGRKPILSCLN